MNSAVKAVRLSKVADGSHSLVEPKEEPLDDFLFTPAENEIPRVVLTGEKICKKEEIDDEITPVPFDVDSFDFPYPDARAIPTHSPDNLTNHKLQTPQRLGISGASFSNDTVALRLSRTEAERLRMMKEQNFSLPPDIRSPTENNQKKKGRKSKLQLLKEEELLRHDTVDEIAQYPNIIDNSQVVTSTKKVLKWRGVAENDVEITRDFTSDNIRRSNNGANHSVSASNCMSKMNDTELECPECNFRTCWLYKWIDHLRRAHSTTPALAGLALLCECGHETLSITHGLKCNIANFTIVRKRNGPIQRLNYAQRPSIITTPKCVLCQFYPRSPLDYANHLELHHKSDLNMNGIFLLCSCDVVIYSLRLAVNHSLKCKNRKFTLSKITEKSQHQLEKISNSKHQLPQTPQCVICEFYPITTLGYAQHLSTHHKSTLQSIGIYLICSCGVEVHYRQSHSIPKSNKMCDGHQFAVRKLNEM